MSKLSEFIFNLNPNEQLDIVVKPVIDERGVLHGVVEDEEGNPIVDAVVKLLEVVDGKMVPITHAFTDKFGQFLFGPLCPAKTYVTKVWTNDVKVNQKPLVDINEPRKGCIEVLKNDADDNADPKMLKHNDD